MAYIVAIIFKGYKISLDLMSWWNRLTENFYLSETVALQNVVKMPATRMGEELKNA